MSLIKNLPVFISYFASKKCLKMNNQKDALQKTSFNQVVLYSFVMLNKSQTLIQVHKRKAKMYRKKAQNLTRLLLSVSFPTRRRSLWSLYRTSRFWETEMSVTGEQKFQEDFRVSRATFLWLVDHLQHLHRQNTSIRPAIELKKRIAVALYALGSSAEYRTIANIFGIGRTTVGEIVLEFCNEICRIFEQEYVTGYPPSQEKIYELVNGFQKWGFPQTYGAVDGCHIEVNPPKDVAINYFNYKGWYSIILLAAVDYRYRFTYLNVGSPGRNNDSYIFEKSALKRFHENHPLFKTNSKIISNTEVPVFLIGDSAFRFTNYLMKPFPITSTRPNEIRFNTALARARRVVENAFGHVKARFRRVGRGLQVKIENAPTVIKACCILHNILNARNESINETWRDELQRAESRREQPEFRTILGNANAEANNIRNAIMEYLAENTE